MPLFSAQSLATALAVLAGPSLASCGDGPSVPSVSVPACPATASIHYDKSVPDKTDFPLTQVDLCYGTHTISLTFTAHDETNFYYNKTQGENDEIYEYEVMEAFIHRGVADPQSYLEFEINPANVTYQAFVYNPSKVRADGAPFDHFFIDSPHVDGFTAKTELHRDKHLWKSQVEIPFGLWNVDDGEAKGTDWRMNFFRTIVSPDTYPNQTLGAWSPPDAANFHITKFLGHVTFV